MPASVIPIAGRRQGTYVLLEAVLPGRAAQDVGVVLIDPESGRGWVRMRERYADLAEPEDVEVLEAIEEDLRGRMDEMGAERVLESLEDSLSNVLRVGDRQSV